MCEACIQVLNDFPTEAIAQMEELRPEIEALAEKIGAKFNGNIVKVYMNEEPTTEELKLTASRLPSHINMLSLAIIAGYITGHKNHDPHMVQETENMFMVGSNVGWAKSHVESMPQN